MNLRNKTFNRGPPALVKPSPLNKLARAGVNLFPAPESRIPLEETHLCRARWGRRSLCPRRGLGSNCSGFRLSSPETRQLSTASFTTLGKRRPLLWELKDMAWSPDPQLLAGYTALMSLFLKLWRCRLLGSEAAELNLAGIEPTRYRQPVLNI